MSEDPKQPDGESEASEPPQEQPEAENLAPDSQNEPQATAPAREPEASEPQYPPPPEVYIQPEATPDSSAQPQYPPPPAAYTQQPEQPQQPPLVQNPYATPPTGYGVPPTGYSYSAPNFAPPPMYGYGYEPFPQAHPLPLRQAVRELPGQYWKILRKPGPRTFAMEQSKAEWGIIWIQILFLMLFETITALPVGLVEISSLTATLSASNSATRLDIPNSVLLVMITIGVIVFTPLVFFASVGIQWLLARAFKGTGSFMQQAYDQLLFQVPIAFLTALLYLIASPFLNGFTSMMSVTSTSVTAINPFSLVVSLLVSLVIWAIGIYGIVLNIFSIMAAQRLSGGRATGVVLLPYAILIVLYFGCVCAGVLVSLSTLH